MYTSHSCPVCSESHETPEAAGFCRCGLGDIKSRKQVEAQISKQMLFLCVKIAVVMIPAIVFLSQYHGLGTDILTLKLQNAIGMSSPQSQTELAQLCERIQRFDCATGAFQAGTQRFPKDLDLWTAWAQLETKNKNLPNAVIAYTGYLANGGTDTVMHYRLARALEDSGKVNEAIAEYGKILDEKTEALQVTVAQNLVRLLMKEHRLDEALQAIKKFQDSADNAKDFLNEELAQVQGLLKKTNA